MLFGQVTHGGAMAKVSSAVLSDCGTYRYSLSRQWDDSRPGIVWIMLNPSTADAEADDPTIRRCIGFSKAWGYGSLTVVNLFGLRATHPMDIRGHHDPVGPANDQHVRMAVKEARRVIVAWGAVGSALGVGNQPTRERVMLSLLAEAGVIPYCLKTTKEGQPWHPLYVAQVTKPQLFVPV
jgi:hypothetical protein